MNGAFIFFDEACIINKAIYFSENLQMDSCMNILKLNAIHQPPLYSILISPIYLFFKGMDAYRTILIFNSFLVSSCIFPLYGLVKKILKKQLVIYLLISFLVFIPQIFILEKTLMTETLFTVINIWLLYFYFQSFEKNKLRNKTLSIFLALFAFMTRPYGFIPIIAIAVNEFIQLFSLKKNKLLRYLFISVLIISIISIIFISRRYITQYHLDTIISAVFSKNGFIELLTAIKNQINSFILPLFYIVLVIFISNLFNKKIKKIRYFLITFIALNFIVSAYHIFGQLLHILNNPDLDLSTRYISVSLFFITLFGFIFLIKNKKTLFNTKNLLIHIFLLIPLFFIKFDFTRYVMNFDIFIYKNLLFNITFITLFIILILLFYVNKKKLLITVLIILYLANSYYGFSFIKTKSSINLNSITQKFLDTEYKLIFNRDENFYYSSPYWNLKSISNNEIYVSLNIFEEENLKDYDYIITRKELNDPEFIKEIDSSYKVYKVTSPSPSL